MNARLVTRNLRQQRAIQRVRRTFPRIRDHRWATRFVRGLWIGGLAAGAMWIARPGQPARCYWVDA